MFVIFYGIHEKINIGIEYIVHNSSIQRLFDDHNPILKDETNLLCLKKKFSCSN